MGVITSLASVEREDDVEELEQVEAPEERRPMGAGVGVRVRIESDLRREEDGCACALLSGWKRVEVSKWTGILRCVFEEFRFGRWMS